MPSLAIAIFRCGHWPRPKKRPEPPPPMPQIVIRRPDSTPHRRQPLLSKGRSAKSPARARLAEFAGGTTAECAAICCCCPCGIVNLVVLAVVKLPAGLCKKALSRKGRKRKVGLLPPEQQQQLELVKRYDDMDLEELEQMVAAETWPESSPSPSVVILEMEQEMWAQLYGTGFWRDPSETEGQSVQERKRER